MTTLKKTTKQKAARARTAQGRSGAKVTNSEASRRPAGGKSEVTEAQMDRLIAASLRRHKKTLDVLADL